MVPSGVVVAEALEFTGITGPVDLSPEIQDASTCDSPKPLVGSYDQYVATAGDGHIGA